MVPVRRLNKKFSSRIFLLSVAGSAALVLLTPLAAQAGFDWTPPEEAVPAASADGSVPALPEEALNGPLTPEPDAPPAVPVEPVQNAADLPVPDEAPQLRASDLVAPSPEPAAEPAYQPAPARVAAPMPTQADVSADVAGDIPASQPRRVRPAVPQQAVDPVSRTNNEVVWAERPRPAPAAEPSEPVFAAETAPAPAAPAPLPDHLDQSIVQGFGKDLSLAIALRQIAPSNYAYRFADGVSAGQKVSWEGGKPWPHVLSDMLSANGLQVVIQGNVITVENSATPARPASAPSYSRTASSMSEPTSLSVDDSDNASTSPSARELEAQERGGMNAASAPMQADTYPDTPVVAVNNTSSEARPPVVDIQNRRRWEAQPGSTLRETLEKWAKSAGTELEWMTPYDYPIKNTFAFQGRFDEAVNSLLASYSREEQRPRGRLYPNLPEGPSVLMVN